MDKPDPASLTESAYGFFVDVNPRFSDVDSQQHLNNVAIAQYYDEARARLSLALFGPNVFSSPGELRLVVAKSSSTYLGEGFYPEPLRIGVRVTHIGTSSYRLAMALFQQGRCLGISESAMVHVGARGPQPLPLPVRESLQALA